MDTSAGHPRWAPAACTLPSADQPVRVAEFDALFAASLRERQRMGPDRLRLGLTATPAVAARVAELAARETSCCSFFTFTVTITGGALWLEVAVPESQVGVLDALAARAEVAAAGSAG